MGARYDSAGRWLPTREEEVELVARAQAGDRRATDVLLRANHGLVHGVVRRYRLGASDRDDAFAEGLAGVLHALSKFDVSLGFRFMTYARFWVQHYVSRHASGCRRSIVGVDSVQRSLYWQLPKARAAIRRRGAEPTDEAVAAELGVSVERVARERADARGDVDVQLLEPFLGDQALDPGALFEAREAEAHDRRALDSLLAPLDPRERLIVERRWFGEETLESISRDLGLTRERVRQIEAAALDRMRRAVRRSRLLKRAITRA